MRISDWSSDVCSSDLSDEVVRDLVAIARHRGWSHVHVTGSETFRRAAWLEASRQGLAVRGYRPTERDLQKLDRGRRDASSNSIAPAVTAPESRDPERVRSRDNKVSRQTRSEHRRGKTWRGAPSRPREIRTQAV